MRKVALRQRALSETMKRPRDPRMLLAKCREQGQAFPMQSRRAPVIVLELRDMAQMVERPGRAICITHQSAQGETLLQQRGGPSDILLYDRLPQRVQSLNDAVVVT